MTIPNILSYAGLQSRDINVHFNYFPRASLLYLYSRVQLPMLKLNHGSCKACDCVYVRILCPGVGKASNSNAYAPSAAKLRLSILMIMHPNMYVLHILFTMGSPEGQCIHYPQCE